MRDAVIVSTARTPIGKAYRGAFNNTHAVDLGGHVISQAVERAGVELEEVEDVIMGVGRTEGCTGGNIARGSAMRAGMPVSVSGLTVSRACSSGLNAISVAAQRIISDGRPWPLAVAWKAFHWCRTITPIHIFESTVGWMKTYRQSTTPC